GTSAGGPTAPCGSSATMPARRASASASACAFAATARRPAGSWRCPPTRSSASRRRTRTSGSARSAAVPCARPAAGWSAASAAADLLLAISDCTRRDLLWYAASRGGLRGRLEVVILGADLPMAAPAARPKRLAGLSPGRFALSVSSIQPRKNFALLHRLWHRLAAEAVAGLPLLVIVGARGQGSDALIRAIEDDPLTRPRIRILDDAGDEELAWLYEHCCWTLYPSFYEGWGLPLSE